MINVTDAANARFARMTTMKKLNPDFGLDDGAVTRSFLEQAFYLSIFGDPYVGVARSDWVLSWFCKSPLPQCLLGVAVADTVPYLRFREDANTSWMDAEGS
jgi:hypothetical protein